MLVLFSILFILPLLVIGITFLGSGLKGRRLDDHPVCRRCRFDLFGLPPNSLRCSECGTDLSVPNSIRIGNRSKRLGLALAGVVLILPTLVFLGILAISFTSEIDWLSYAPHWYVHRQAASPTPAVRDPAVAELLRRLNSSSLTHSQIATDVDIGLAVQADLKSTWFPQWGDFIEIAHATNKVSNEKWLQYLTGIPTCKVSASATVRRGESLVIAFQTTQGRCSTHSRFWIDTTLAAPDAYPYIETKFALPSSSGPIPVSGTFYFRNPVVLIPDAISKISDGPKTFHLRVTSSIYTTKPSPNQQPDAVSTVNLTANWTLTHSPKSPATNPTPGSSAGLP